MAESTISPLQVIFRAYPHAFRNTTQAITQVRTVNNQAGDRGGLLAQRIRTVIAARINVELAKRAAHAQERVHRAQLREQYGHSQPETAAGSPGDQFVPDIFIGEDELATGAPTHSLTRAPAPLSAEHNSVPPRRIGIIPVDSMTRVVTRVYPRTFHCHQCEHFVILDPGNPPPSLTCPCCGHAPLIQEPMLFFCFRCAEKLELCPPGARLSGDQRRARSPSSVLGGPPSCPDCQGGHIHLNKHGHNDVARWTWACSNCTGYTTAMQAYCLNCALPSVPPHNGPAAEHQPGTPSSVVMMSALPAAAPNALSPLTHQALFVAATEVTPETLDLARQEAAGGPDAFDLSSPEYSALREDLRVHGVTGAYLLPRLDVATSVYGYKAGRVTRVGQAADVDEDEQLSQFFEDPSGVYRFLTFTLFGTGQALVLQFSKSMIASRLTQSSCSALEYDQMVGAEIQQAAALQSRQFLEPSAEPLPVYRAMHTLEHAILTGAQRQIGNDQVLGSQLFFREAMLLVFEREDVGRGGVVQLVNYGQGLLTLLRSAADQVSGCAQGCSHGCPGCVFVRDLHCNQLEEELNRTWIPRNGLLNRIGARRILNPSSLT